jgi:hypothetical protein
MSAFVRMTADQSDITSTKALESFRYLWKHQNQHSHATRLAVDIATIQIVATRCLKDDRTWLSRAADPRTIDTNRLDVNTEERYSCSRKRGVQLP